MNKARGKSGPLFNFDVHDDIRLLADATVEKDEVSSPLFHIFLVGVDYIYLFLMSSHVTNSQSYGFESWPHPPLVARRQVGGEELVPAQQAYLPSVTLGGFRPREELRKIHNRVVSISLPMRVFFPSYGVHSISSLQENCFCRAYQSKMRQNRVRTQRALSYRLPWQVPAFPVHHQNPYRASVHVVPPKRVD